MYEYHNMDFPDRKVYPTPKQIYDIRMQLGLDLKKARLQQLFLFLESKRILTNPFYMERNVQSITAVDLSPEMVKIAKSKFPQANVICGDAENITFDSQFDVIMIYNAFPHFPEPVRVIENFTKHLKDGGRLSIAHGLSKKELDEIHMKSAGRVSNILPECDELAEMLKPYFNVDIMISNDTMYQVSGMKR